MGIAILYIKLGASWLSMLWGLTQTSLLRFSQWRNHPPLVQPSQRGENLLIGRRFNSEIAKCQSKTWEKYRGDYYRSNIIIFKNEFLLLELPLWGGWILEYSGLMGGPEGWEHDGFISARKLYSTWSYDSLVHAEIFPIYRILHVNALLECEFHCAVLFNIQKGLIQCNINVNIKYRVWFNYRTRFFFLIKVMVFCQVLHWHFSNTKLFIRIQRPDSQLAPQ